MEEEIKQLHLRVGAMMNPARACGKKVDYRSEETATKAAEAMNSRETRTHELEPYPCAHCGGWHIGRKMPIEELRSYEAEAVSLI